MSLESLSRLFLLFSALMAVVVVGLLARYLAGRARLGAIAVFVLWVLYTGVLGYTGVVASKSPPGPVFLLVPTAAFIAAFVVRHSGVRSFALSVPVELLLALQSFRVIVELALYELNQHRLVPRAMTFEGGNLDILIGASAPLVAYLYRSRRINDRVVRVWSIVGLVLLANIVARSILTFGDALKTEVPNVGIGMFPFPFIPGFLAPLAICLHVLVLRALSPRSGPRPE
jgi:hypothetical protein